MGMCKGCGVVFNTSEMEYGYCKDCITDDIRMQGREIDLKEFEEGIRGTGATKTIMETPEYKSLAQLLFSLEGRITRTHFWLIFLGQVIITFLIILLFGLDASLSVGNDLLSDSNKGNLDHLGIYVVLIIPYVLLMLWIDIAINIKRLHDLNRSGWYYLLIIILSIIPITAIPASIFYIIYFGFFRGTIGQNKYGKDPRGFAVVLKDDYFVAKATVNENTKKPIIDENIKYCYKCGTQSSVDVNFCQNCGTEITKGI